MARVMKDSGVEWIGEIPEDWGIVNIGRLFNVKAGGDAKPDIYSDIQDAEHPFPVYTNSNDKEQVYAYTSTPYFKKNTITVTGRGEIGRAFFRNVEYDAIIRLLVLQPKVDMDARFYTYWIDKVIVFLTNSAAIGQLSAQQILPYKIPILDIDTQRRIADFLDDKVGEIDTIISKTKESIEEYKKYKQAVITEAITQGLDKSVEMVDTDNIHIPTIPAHWKMKKIKYIFEIKKDIAGKEGYDILSITQKGIKIKDISKNEGQLAQNYSNYQLVDIGDFAMNHMDLLTGWVDISKYLGVTSPDYRVFRFIDAIAYDANYYLYLMQMCYINKIFYGLGQGVSNLGRWRLQADKFLNFTIPKPPLKEQQEIAKYLSARCIEIDALIAKKEVFVEEMETYKKSLIYEYVTGKKEVL